MGKKRQRDEKKSKLELSLEEDVFGKDILAEVSKANELKDGCVKDVLESPKAAWIDDDDDEIEISLDSSSRLRKLKKKGEVEGVMISGTDFQERLAARLNSRALQWATQYDDLNNRSMMDSVLNSTASFTSTARRTRLPSGRVDIARQLDANADGPSNDTISTLSFHSSGSLLLTGGQDKHLRFFAVDGETNEKQLSVKIADMSITSASFRGQGNEVVVAGRKPFFYAYDTVSGRVDKFPGLMTRRGLQSHERMSLSPEGNRIAFVGKSGYIHVLDGRQKTWICDVKMNSGCRAATFANERTLITSGVDADVYVWDLRRTGRCLTRAKHDDGTPTSVLASSPALANNRSDTGPVYHLAIGAESGVVSLLRLDPSSSADTMITPIKSFLNLTTKITCASFSPSGEMMAFGSDHKRDQLRMCHIQSASVFSNWPTERTPIRRPHSLAWSPNNRYFSVGNNKGQALLYQLNHYVPVPTVGNSKNKNLD